MSTFPFLARHRRWLPCAVRVTGEDGTSTCSREADQHQGIGHGFDPGSNPPYCAEDRTRWPCDLAVFAAALIDAERAVAERDPQAASLVRRLRGRDLLVPYLVDLLGDEAPTMLSNRCVQTVCLDWVGLVRICIGSCLSAWRPVASTNPTDGVCKPPVVCGNAPTMAGR